ncbi:MAG TPA: prolyl oligopeptidase family serine peptidase, partial [Polymorphobacter sp.]|nr:prolyl oligopeptidase family serine peptidase [Polymorphobacter sp.]
ARLDKITASELQTFMASSTVPHDFDGKFAPAKYAVKLYRVTYRSVVPELGNRPTVASGLVAIPQNGVRGAQTLPVVSYQHGTVFDKSWVPSNPDSSAETRIMIAAFAAQGYVVIGADYFGRGISDLPDSYLVKRSTQQAAYDMLVAANDVLKAQQVTPGKLFVSGWSQGGWGTMVFLQRLEELGIKVTAAAAASAPVDVYLTTVRWMSNPQPVDAVYLPGCTALQLQAQEYYLQQSGLTEAAINPQYLAMSRAFYAGKMSWEDFYKATGPKLAGFLRPEFVASGAAGTAPYWQVLQDNQAYRWKSVTPLRAYIGGSDEVTPAYIGKLPQATQALLGGATATTIDAGAKADHRGVFVFGVLDQKLWFDSMLK